MDFLVVDYNDQSDDGHSVETCISKEGPPRQMHNLVKQNECVKRTNNSGGVRDLSMSEAKFCRRNETHHPSSKSTDSDDEENVEDG